MDTEIDKDIEMYQTYEIATYRCRWGSDADLDNEEDHNSTNLGYTSRQKTAGHETTLTLSELNLRLHEMNTLTQRSQHLIQERRPSMKHSNHMAPIYNIIQLHEHPNKSPSRIQWPPICVPNL